MLNKALLPAARIRRKRRSRRLHDSDTEFGDPAAFKGEIYFAFGNQFFGRRE